MCELLINIGNRQNGSDLSWRNGDVVVAMADGHMWGNKEHKPSFLATGGKPADWGNHFMVVKVPDMTVEEARSLMRAVAIDGDGKPLNRSGMRIRQDMIDPVKLAEGLGKGELLSNRAAVLATLEVL